MIHKDIIYGDVELNGIYEEIVNCSDFTRLKDIVQTAMATIKYEELSEETRYEHSIGVYYLMCKTLNNLEEKLSVYGLQISNEEKELAKMSALLHDIGHGVHSHLLEGITGVSHELRGISIIKDNSTQINKIISKYYGEDFVHKLAEFMDCIYGNGEIDKSIELQENNTVPLKSLLASLISHNIDLDRIDYLTRESTYTKMGALCNYKDLINSFECVLAGNQIILAVPKDKQYLIEANIFERSRNYDKIYYCEEDTIGNFSFELLLKELRNHPEEVPDTISETIRKFLTQENTDLTNNEYMELTDSPVNDAINEISKTTQNEKIKYLCNIRENVKNDYQVLYNSKSKTYIKKLLKKVIPGFRDDSDCLISDTKVIKPYKKTKFGSTNIITEEGIQKFENLPHFVNITPVMKSLIAINPQILRLELGISKEEFEEKYSDVVQEIITSQAKPIQEFELKYLLKNENISIKKIMSLLKKFYKIKDEANYYSTDVYYDSKDGFPLLERESALRIREGTTYYKGEESRDYKSKRITYKVYVEDKDTIYTTRSRLEEIGDTVNLEDYREFLETIGITEELSPILEVTNYRKLITIMANGQQIDISFCVSNYRNCLDDISGDIKTIEIRPRDNKILGRVLLLEIKQKLESKFPELSQLVTNSNVYRIAMTASYEKQNNNNENQDKER